MTPYLAYWMPEHLGGSGVLATVAAGLYVSWNGPRLIPAATRLQGIFFWDLIIYLIEGFVFLVTGLQARTLIEKAHDFPVRELLVATAITAAIVIVARFVWVFPATYLPRWLIPAARATRSVAAVAAAVHHRFHRRARRGLACRGARHSIDDRERRAIPAARPDSVRHLRRHHHHAGRPGTDAAGRHRLDRRRRARKSRAPPRAGGRACGTQRGDPRVAASSGKNRERAESQPGDRRSSSTRVTITASGLFPTIWTMDSKPCVRATICARS